MKPPKTYFATSPTRTTFIVITQVRIDRLMSKLESKMGEDRKVTLYLHDLGSLMPQTLRQHRLVSKDPAIPGGWDPPTRRRWTLLSTVE